MAERKTVIVDGNEAVAHVAYNVSEVIAIYPITPSSPMGEWADAWSAKLKNNIWGDVPAVVEMQSEGGVAGAMHGALQTGSLASTFTASQGLLLMIPNMYKIAGELTPFVLHVAARTIATQGLSIFGDHSDVMAARATGFAMLCSNSPQEATDLAMVSHIATLESRVPFMHFFDGFRTSHEENKVELLTHDDMRELLPMNRVFEHRARGLSPDRPVLRGTSQNPDVHFQAKETVNPFYNAVPQIVQNAMDKYAAHAGRQYHLFEYSGAPDATRVIVIMGSGAEAVEETIEALQGEKIGLLKVRLYRPFDVKRFMEKLPASTQKIAVLDRTKEPGSIGEPLYQDVLSALHEGLQEGWGSLKTMPRVVGGRYGLSSKEFNPAMIQGIFDELKKDAPKNHFTIGITDDVTNTSLEYDESFSVEKPDVVRALFYGLGSDGTVGANKNSIKIIGENTPNYAQGYFVYDSKKSGAITVSHLRFGPRPIRSTYLISRANFLACHQPVFLERYNILENLEEGGTFLLNAPLGPDNVWLGLPEEMRAQIVAKKIKFFVINATDVAQKSGMGRRINTIMQVCFFALSDVLPREEAIAAIKESIRKTYGSKGDEVVAMNLRAVDNTLEHLHQVQVPESAIAEYSGNEEIVPAGTHSAGMSGGTGRGLTANGLQGEPLAPGEEKDIKNGVVLPPILTEEAPKFVREVLGEIVAGRGEQLPVSALPVDGTFPTGTAALEKRNLALDIPVWETDICIQCGKCAMVCPHGVIRIKTYDEKELENAPATFKSCDAKDREWKGQKYTIQVAPEDCTGCGICVDICPAKDKREARRKAINMEPQPPLREAERENWDFFLNLPELDRTQIKTGTIRQQQVQQPLFEFSGACSGCGETPYIKLASQLFGDRMVVANATGCSSIYGGNLPTTPWTKNADGRGPAWCNSLFEDNAEFGLGFRLSIDKQTDAARSLLQKLSDVVGEELVQEILNAPQKDDADIYEQRARVEKVKAALQGRDDEYSAQLLSLADMLVKKSVWIIGGDGWAYDIDYGGLDHVLASGRNVNILVLDTEVYSNTGGQMSKSTPRAAVAKFAAGGKPAGKKDLGLLAMAYGNVYVASVAMGARDEHTLKAFLEAEAFDGPSLIIAYSHCIAHGINMTTAMQNQKAAVESGQWLLYRFNPDRVGGGENPLQVDSRAPKMPVSQYMYMENRFKMLTKSDAARAKELLEQAQADVDSRWRRYQIMAEPHKLNPVADTQNAANAAEKSE